MRSAAGSLSSSSQPAANSAANPLIAAKARSRAGSVRRSSEVSATISVCSRNRLTSDHATPAASARPETGVA
jgi:hypothetical protein